MSLDPKAVGGSQHKLFRLTMITTVYSQWLLFNTLWNQTDESGSEKAVGGGQQKPGNSHDLSRGCLCFWFLTYESGSKTLLVIANTGFLS